MLKEQVDPNVQYKDGVNAFILACQNGHAQIVELLMKEQVADPNVQSKDGVNAFMMACHNGHTQIVELLLKKQVDPNAQDKDGVNAFMAACQNGHTQIVELLLKEQVDPNVQNKDGVNAFMVACASGQTQIVELLLKEQVDPNVQNKNGVNAFMWACQNGHTQIVERLLNDINLNTTDKNGCTALIKTCFSKTDSSEIIVQLLLDAGADPEVQAESNIDEPFVDGCTALMFAIISSHLQAVKLLLEAGADPNLKHTSGMTPFAVAVMIGQPNIVKILLESGANINDNISFNSTSFITDGTASVHDSTVMQNNVLMIACQCGHLDIVQTLLENGADPCICDNNGNNALHHTLLSETSGRGTLEITLLLLRTVDPNIANYKGRTALMYACRNGHCEVVEHLLRTNDIDLSLTDNDGSTALWHAAKGGYNEVINVLLSNYDYNQEEIERALTAACYGGHKEVIKELTDKANLTEYQKDIVTACISDDVTFVASGSLNLPLIESTGLTPLMLASSCGSDGVVQVLLLIPGADVNKQDKYLQYSPLLYAVSGSKSVAMVQYLLDHGANVNVISSDEQTSPLDIARHYELDDITQLLESKGGKTYSSVMKLAVKEVQIPLSSAQKVINNIDLNALDTNVVTGSISFNIHVPSFSLKQILPNTLIATR